MREQLARMCDAEFPTDRRKPLHVITSSATHSGYRRPVNQDAFLSRPDIGLWAVADGVGGLAAGEKASRAVVRALAPIEGREPLADEIARRIILANNDLRLEALIECAGSTASTVVALTVDPILRTFTCLWAGDSRLYRVRAGMVEQLTRDHTMLQDCLAAGRRPPVEWKLAHALTRAVGTEECLNVDRVSGALQPDDTFVLCTDGLSKLISPAQISRHISTATSASAAQRLVEAALEAGGTDNVTAIVITFSATPAERWPGSSGKTAPQQKKLWPRLWAIAILAAALAVLEHLYPALWRNRNRGPGTSIFRGRGWKPGPGFCANPIHLFQQPCSQASGLPLAVAGKGNCQSAHRLWAEPVGRHRLQRLNFNI